MAIANLRSDWEGGDLVFRRRLDGAAIATLSADGFIVHSLVEGATSAEDINLSLLPIANVAAPGIWNNAGDITVGTDT